MNNRKHLTRLALSAAIAATLMSGAVMAQDNGQGQAQDAKTSRSS